MGLNSPPPHDLTAERAAATLLGRMGLVGHPADAQFIGDILEFRRQTRQEALREAARVVREFVKHYPTDIFIEPLPGQHGKTVDGCSASAIRAICPTIANELDRLASEGG